MDIAYTDFKKFKSPTKAFIGPVLLVCFSEPKQIQTVLNSLHTAEKAFQYKFTDDFFHEGLITASCNYKNSFLLHEITHVVA